MVAIFFKNPNRVVGPDGITQVHNVQTDTWTPVLGMGCCVHVLSLMYIHAIGKDSPAPTNANVSAVLQTLHSNTLAVQADSTTNANVPAVQADSTTNANVPAVQADSTTNANVLAVQADSTTNAHVPAVQANSTTTVGASTTTVTAVINTAADDNTAVESVIWKDQFGGGGLYTFEASGTPPRYNIADGAVIFQSADPADHLRLQDPVKPWPIFNGTHYLAFRVNDNVGYLTRHTVLMASGLLKIGTFEYIPYPTEPKVTKMIVSH